ncbi:hypothetical protein M8J75_014646 [Diaphorina citri]|nr:hypothetical protein M8J75_014646 [Diaphorina citri]
MPKLIQVKSLYTITLKQVNSILCELAQNDQCSPDTVTWIKSHLHGNIREQLLAQFNQWHLPYNFNYMKCVIDCSLKSIVLNECLSNRAMTGLNYIEFMKYLHEQNICNLCNFSLHFKKYLLETAKLKEGNYYLCLSLNNGMARNLTTVVLPYVADNSVLKCLGQHCTQLVYLDIANSWNIDEDGIFNLLFKNPEDLNLPVDDISSEMDPPSECLLDELTVPDEELNPVCFTIQEIRIQDTNTSPTNLFIILLTVKNLKSLGGYLYFRSVGDAIVTLKSNNPSLKLNLTHLWDAHLPPLKLDTLAQVLPHLTTLSTRVSNLPFKRAATSPRGPTHQRITPRYNALLGPPCEEHYWPFRNVTHLTLDFDFFYYDELFHTFLKHNGHSLIKLVLVDQPYNFNLLWIHQHCPLLQDLTACVMVPEEARSLLPQMSALRSAALTLNSEHTLLAVFQMLPCALQLTIKIRLSYNMYENGITYAGTVQDLCALDLPCYNSLQDLRLHFVSETVPEPGFGVSEAIKLLELFKNLRTFGNLDTWGSAMNLATLHDHVKAKRWDVALKRGFDICEESNVFYR